MAKSRNKTDDVPTITVRMEKGRLVPVSQFDYELLNSWREGAVLNINPVLAQTRPLEKRYFAMLTKLLKSADTPWSNVQAAHKAIKEVTGFIDPYQKEDGEWDAHQRHISTFSDTELSEFVELFCGIVERKFGIDPDTLRKEAASSDAGALAHASDGGPGASPASVGVSDPETPSSTNPGDGGEANGGGDGITPHTPLSFADLAWLKDAARMMVSASAPGGEVDILLRQAHGIKDEIPAGISRRARDLMSKVYKHCLHSTRENAPLDKKLVAALAGCEVADLRPEAR